MITERIAYLLFERQAKTYADDDNIVDTAFIWQTEDGVREFWIEEATAILGWLGIKDKTL